MSNPNQKSPSDNLPSSSNNVIRLGSSSPSVPNQTGKSTKERIDEQIGALKDALAIPFLASPPPSSHEENNPPPQPPKSQPPPTHLHFTPTPYPPSTADTTYYEIKCLPIQPHPVSNPYNPTTTMALAIPPYLQQQHFNPPMPDFQHHTHTPDPYSSPPHLSSSQQHHPSQFSHETATPRQPHPQSNPYATSNAYARQEQLDRTIKEARQRRAAKDDCRYTASIIAAVVKVIRSGDALLSDGSNYRKWACCLKELASQFIYDPDFFTKPTTNIHNEKIGRAIILHSVDV
jgi:hypothetical protein